jgi:hypothetical protein
MRAEGGGYRRDYLRALAQRVEVDAQELRIIWLVSFMGYYLGYFDDETWSDEEGRPQRFQLRELMEALQRGVQLINWCLVGSGRRSSQTSVVGAGTSCRPSCIHADRFVTDSSASGDARPRSRDRGRHRLCPPSLVPSQRERPVCGWRLLSEGLGRAALGAHQAASTQKDRHRFACRKNAKTVLLFRLLRSRLTLAHPLLAAKAGLPRSAAQQP